MMNDHYPNYNQKKKKNVNVKTKKKKQTMDHKKNLKSFRSTTTYMILFPPVSINQLINHSIPNI